MRYAVDVFRPYEYPFFVRGVVVATLAGLLCGLIGVFITLRGMSYLGHGMSHAIYGGFAAATLLGVNVFLGAGAWGVATGIAIARVARKRSIGADAAIGVITISSFALGVALFKRYGTRGKTFDATLFGSILGIQTADIVALAVVTALSITVVVLRYRSLLFTTFDPDVAEVSGVSVVRTEALLMLLLSLAILVTLSVIGVTLVAASLVIPPVVARMLTDSFRRMLWLSALIGAVTGLVGMNLSYHVEVPSGTMIVLTGSAVFAAVLALTGGRGLRRTAGVHTA